MDKSQEHATEMALARKGVPEWKWKGAISVIFLLSLINGYDVSNVANIQPRLYEALGRIDLLPWIGLSYSLANFAILSLARKLTYFCDMRWIYLASSIVFIAGAALAGAALNMQCIIVGRVIMGFGGAVIQQTNFSYFAVFATTAETPKLVGTMSAMWATGLVIGGPIGSALAENEHTTWRWAFYLNLPLVGFGLVVAFFCMPNHYMQPKMVARERILKFDFLGVACNLIWPFLFATYVTLSGSDWAWTSGKAWALFAVTLVVGLLWLASMVFGIGTAEEDKAVPTHLLSRLDLLPIFVASGCAGASYAITIYYTPLFFAFTRGYGAMEQSVRLLPFILVFIVVVMLTGGLLPIIGRYKIIYLIAGASTLAGAAAMAATMDATVSEAQIMGLEALLGFGLGMHFQHGAGISNIINKNARDRVDGAVLCNMSQMGGIAIMLAIAGSIFQNVGYSLLEDALGVGSYPEDDIREALAGVSSPVWGVANEKVRRDAISAVADVISREFFIVVVSGALCLLAAVCMKGEKLDYGRKKKQAPVQPGTESPSP